MKRKFEKFKDRRKRKAKEARLKYVSLNNLKSEECKAHKIKPKRLKSDGKTKPLKHRQTEQKETVCSDDSSVIKSTNQMMDLRPLVIEIFD